MAFSNKPHYNSMVILSCTLVVIASALDVSNVVVKGPASGSDLNGFLPLAKKHVTIGNFAPNGEILNAHCKSSETDFGIVHIPWGKYWGFSFRVNFSKSTKFRCHFTWRGGGSHYFNIFKVSRDDNPFGKIPVCKECIWVVGKVSKDYPICRVNRDVSPGYCFPWDETDE